MTTAEATALAKFIREAMNLPVESRLALASRLIDSVNQAPPTPAAPRRYSDMVGLWAKAKPLSEPDA